MNSAFQRLFKHRKAVTVLLATVFVLLSLYLVDVKVFVRPPGLGGDAIFIGEAKTYYFEGSSVNDKDIKFSNPVYKDLWLSLPGVSNVLTADELPGADQDFDTGDIIHYITVDDQQVDRMSAKMSSSQQQLYENALNQVSAAAWERAKSDLAICAVIWACFGVVFVVWRAYLRKMQCLSVAESL